MTSDLDKLEFPVVAFSTAGWSKAASSAEELTAAAPTDALEDWPGMEIIDSSGRCFVVARVYRAWPASRWGGWLCRLLNHSIHVGFEFEPPRLLTVAHLCERLEGEEKVPDDLRGKTHREILQFVCGTK